jgi:hypothetical protein
MNATFVTEPTSNNENELRVSLSRMIPLLIRIQFDLKVRKHSINSKRSNIADTELYIICNTALMEADISIPKKDLDGNCGCEITSLSQNHFKKLKND